MHEKKKTLRIAFDELELALERTRVRRHMLRNAFALFKLSCQRMREKNTLRIAFEEFELACERTRLTRHVLRSAFPVFKLSCQRMREEKLAQRKLETLCRESEESMHSKVEINWTNSALKSFRNWLAVGAIIAFTHTPVVEASLGGNWSSAWTFTPATVTFSKLVNCEHNRVCAKPNEVPNGV